MNIKEKLLLVALLVLLIINQGTLSQTIEKENISSAEKIIGLDFTDAERDSMLGFLTEQVSNYKKIRDVELNNNILPAIVFNPIPIGFNFPTKKITSTELTKLCIQRFKKYDPILHCVITITEERALKQAKLMDEEIKAGMYRGILHGIPFGVKDLLATKDYKTTWGSVPFKDQMIDEDATVIKKLEEAGAVLVSKLTMGELAWGDVWFGGKTRNPWDTANGSSGSSAGPASAVSAGLIPFAIGTETWGSIVSPSTVCGVTGLRPTYGRVSRTGAMALSWSMDKIGTICRTAEDLAIVFNIINGSDGIDQTLYDVPFNYEHVIDFKNLKIGYLKNDFDKEYDFHVNDSITLAVEASAAFDELTRDNNDDLMVRQIKRAWPNSFRASRFIPAVEYINANRIRFQLIQEMQKLMEKVDLYVAPSWQGDNLLLTNLTGHPCVVLPDGFSEKGTPTSISFTGKMFDEGKLIAFAK